LNEAEKNCLHRLKESAFNKGASAVIGLQVRYAELSNANGMIMVNMAGTAVAVGKMRLL
jgi:uncharacterized protein YbjQ (UPF0145 family)